MTYHALHQRRWRLAIALTAVMVVVYFGFIALIAYQRAFMGTLLTPGLTVGILLGAMVIVIAWLLTWWYVRWANSHFDARLEELRREAMTGSALGARLSAYDSAAAPATTIGQPNARGDGVLLPLHRDHPRHHLLGGAAHAHHRAVLRGRPQGLRGAERLRARRRLHVRRELPRHRGTRRHHRLRRAHLLHRLARRLAGGALPDRRAAPEPRQVHLRRRRRDAHEADAGAARLIARHALHGHPLSHRADGRRRHAHPAHVRPLVRDRGGDRRRGDDRLRALRRDDRHHVGADREGVAAPRRRDAARPARARTLRDESRSRSSPRRAPSTATRCCSPADSSPSRSTRSPSASRSCSAPPGCRTS